MERAHLIGFAMCALFVWVRHRANRAPLTPESPREVARDVAREWRE